MDAGVTVKGYPALRLLGMKRARIYGYRGLGDRRHGGRKYEGVSERIQL